MADGTIRIGTRINNTEAQKDAKELERMCERAAEKIKQTGKAAKFNIDTKMAEKEIKQLEKEIESLNSTFQKALSGNNSAIQNFNFKSVDLKSRISELERKMEEFGNTQFLTDMARHLDEQLTTADKRFENITDKLKKAEALGTKPESRGYQSLLYDLEKESEYIKQIRVNMWLLDKSGKACEMGIDTSVYKELNGLLSSAKAKLEQMCLASEQNTSETEQTANAEKNAASAAASQATAQNKSTRSASGLRMVLSSALKLTSKMASTIGGFLLKSLQKAGTSIKNGITKGLKTAASHLTSLKRNTDSWSKKLLRTGASMLGIYGIMGGIRQIVSSAMNDNEELQNRLTAIKGILGEGITPLINMMVNGLSQIVSFADKIYQIFTGTSLIAKYNAKQADKLASGTQDAANAAKAYKNQLASFDVANKLQDDNDAANTDATPIFEAVDISKWLNSIVEQMKKGDWYGVGEEIAKGINSAIDRINWADIQTKINGFCTDIGKSVNGFVDMLDWADVGNAAGEAINTITSGMNSLVDTIQWDNIGTGLATSLNITISTIDAEELGRSLTVPLRAAFDTLGGFCETFEWENGGGKLAEIILNAVESISWGDAGEIIHNFITGFCGAVSKCFDVLGNDSEESKTVAVSIKNFIEGLDIPDIVLSLSKVIFSITNASFRFLQSIDAVFWDAFWNAICNRFGWELEGYQNIKLANGFTFTFPKINFKFGKNTGAEGENEESFIDKLKKFLPSGGAITMSLNGKTTPSFDSAKKQYDSIKDKTATTKSDGSILSSFTNLKMNWDSIKDKMPTTTIKGSIQRTFSSLKTNWDNIKNKTVTVVATAKDNASSIFKNIVNSFIDYINAAINNINSKLKITVGPLLSRLINMPRGEYQLFSVPNIPKLAKGGIVNNPGQGVTATIGEAGKEAVLPLERNTGWMDTLASKINGASSNSTIIVPVYLDSREIARYTIDAQNKRAFALNQGGAY